jgi:hypothetical protein
LRVQWDRSGSVDELRRRVLRLRNVARHAVVAEQKDAAVEAVVVEPVRVARVVAGDRAVVTCTQ